MSTVNAVTKSWQSEETIIKIIEKTLGRKIEQAEISCPSGGFFSAIYIAAVEGEKYVVKLAQGNDIKVMRHEYGFIKTEAEMLKRMESLPFEKPRLLLFDDSRTICEVPYFVMSYLDGTPLSDVQGLCDEQREKIQYCVGKATADMCSVQCDYFGIPAIPETYTDRNSAFVYRLFEMLLQDAEEANIQIPSVDGINLTELLHSFEKALDSCKKPVLVHADTWAGNVMVKDGKFGGLIDYALVMYGDPLLSHDFYEFGDSPTSSFLQGYGKNDFTGDELIRIQIYRIWLRLSMVVERGYRGYSDPHMYDWVIDLYVQAVRELKDMA